MTKKDYHAIGEALRLAGDTVRTAPLIADVFEKDSPRFDRERFLRFVATGKDTRENVPTLSGRKKE